MGQGRDKDTNQVDDDVGLARKTIEKSAMTRKDD